MKKLGIIIAAASLSIAAPVFACPHEDGAAPKTAEKAKDEKGQDKAKEQPKTDTAKKAPDKTEKTDTAKAKEPPKKEEPKKTEKVSQK